MGKIVFSRQEIAAAQWRKQAIQETSLLAFARKQTLAVFRDTVKLARKNAGLPVAVDGKKDDKNVRRRRAASSRPLATRMR